MLDVDRAEGKASLAGERGDVLGEVGQFGLGDQQVCAEVGGCERCGRQESRLLDLAGRGLSGHRSCFCVAASQPYKTIVPAYSVANQSLISSTPAAT